MSEEEFEVRGSHEGALEGETGEWDAFSSKIAVTTAILATVGALFSSKQAQRKMKQPCLKMNSGDRSNFCVTEFCSRLN